VEQLREELQNLENEEVQVLKDRIRLMEEIPVLYKDVDKYVSYNKYALELLRKGCNVACPDRHAATRASSSDHAGTSKQGGTPVDTDIDDSRVDPPENHAVGEPGNVHTDSHLKSPSDHD